MAPSKTVFVVGGTGAQGIPVIQELVKNDAYAVRVLTRDTTSRRALEVAKLPNVDLFQGHLDNDEHLRQGLRGCWGAFISIDGFVVGQKNETFWGIRAYQLAHEAGIQVRHWPPRSPGSQGWANGLMQFFVWGNLDYVTREANYAPDVRCGHYDAKGLVGAWILAQDAFHAARALASPGRRRDTTTMRAALFTTRPYLDMCVAAFTPVAPRAADDRTLEWRVPLGREDAVAHIALEDCGRYAKWLFDHAFTPSGEPGGAAGMDLAVATEHVRYDDLAASFTRVTGHAARFVDVSFEEYFAAIPPRLRGYKFGQDYAGMKEDDGSLLTYEENFRGFWRMWQLSGGSEPLIKRDYALLDKILPDRVRSAEEWFGRHRDMCERVVRGESVIKRHEDTAGIRHSAPGSHFNDDLPSRNSLGTSALPTMSSNLGSVAAISLSMPSRSRVEPTLIPRRRTVLSIKSGSAPSRSVGFGLPK
ncbi:hypothetical protein LTR53_009401 [Teratosphaeriaceae sp. CCFEE 6253]|nr:hypothetical protein LTR53_009401 [Teratosphaeriaceae sp. CCFEE 6253]